MNLYIIPLFKTDYNLRCLNIDGRVNRREKIFLFYCTDLAKQLVPNMND